MPTFRYQHGDRPLDGFTIEHGVGRGGFGEVYYAISDSGRQVALKAVQNYEEVELRGIGHCMNLKSPYLVNIFDVKRNDDGQPFVIMEFVAGPSLRQLLDESPEGLGTAKSAYFLREIAKGLTYLHDRGIVHRDLKPHNVFYEDGFVKIGDYSLSKVMTASHRSAHTMTVGTVHYMAPEISMGRYDHTVDIYALGIMLYEMITGRPPFEGESVGEVLMRHMAGEVDVSGIEQPLAGVIQKALAKDPADRYQSAQELVEAVYGVEHIRNSVTAFNPNSLSAVAEKVAHKMPVRAGVEGASASMGTQPYAPAAPSASREATVGPRRKASRGFAFHVGRATTQFASHVGIIPAKWTEYDGPVNDPIDHRRRVTLGAITIVVFVIGILFVTDGHRRFRGNDETMVTFEFMTMAAITFGSAIVRRRILPRLENESTLLYRLIFGGMACVATMPIGIMWASSAGHSLGILETLSGVLVSMFALDWRVMTTPVRPKRVSLAPALVAGLVGMVAAAMFDGHPLIAFGIVAGIAMSIQVASPFDPVAARKYGPGFGWVNSLSHAVASSGDGPDQKTPEFEVPSVEPVNVSSTTSTSPQSRLATLLLCLVPFCGVPVFGLQRFYAGKVGTGFLWLVTFGFIYIGQLVDLVRIALGQFRDSDDRLILAWTGSGEPTAAAPNMYATPVNQYSSIPADSQRLGKAPLRLGSLFLTMLGGILLMFVLLLGLVLAVDLPSAVAAGVFDPLDIVKAREIEDVIGMEDWPPMIQQIVLFFASILMTLTVIVLITARRGLGIWHMMRVIVSVAGMVLAMFFVYAAFNFGDWDAVGKHLQESKIGPAIDAFMNPRWGPPVIIPFGCAALAFIASFFFLAWPAKQPATLVQAPQPEREVVRQ